MSATPRKLAQLSSLIVLLALSSRAFAQERPAALDFNLDPATTAIHWTLNTTLHTVHGTFKLKNGSFKVDPATGEAHGLIIIDAASGESGDSARDHRMNNVVLETAKYPTITFRPTHVNGKLDLNTPGPLSVSGMLNLHGQDHPLQITVNIHPKDTTIASQTHFTIPFVAWGLKDPSTFIFRVDKEVALDIDATAIQSVNSAHLSSQ